MTYPAGRSVYGLTAGTGITLTPGNGITTITASGASPGGSSGQLQYNNAGSFGGLEDLTWDGIYGLKIRSGYDLNFYNSSNSNYVSIRARSALADSYQLLLPLDNGLANQVLTTDGTGTLSWTTASGAPGGSNTQIQFNNSGSLGGSSNLTWDGINVQIGATGELRLADTDSSNYIALKSPATVATNVTYTLPTADGTNGQVLTTNGSGVTSWTSVSGGTGMKAITAAMIWG